MSVGIQRDRASHRQLGALNIQHSGRGEQCLIGVELQFGDQSKSISRRQRASRTRCQLLNGGAGMFIERRSLNRFSRLRSDDHQRQGREQTTASRGQRKLLRERLITQTL